MKRGGPLRRTEFRRRAGSALRRQPRRKGQKVDREASRQWWLAITKGIRGVVGHHILTQRHLERRAKELEVDPNLLWWDTRVGMPVGEQRHLDHHFAPGKRLTRAEVLHAQPRITQFVREWGLEWLFDREYPA